MQRETPSFTEFDPRHIPWQYRVLHDIDNNYNYKNGVHELLFSGSYGSAKSILAAHIAVRHCVQFERSRVLLGRFTMPDLKDTILATVLDHMEGDFEEGVDFEHDKTKSKIIFLNGSEIITRSWADRKFKKMRSLKISCAIIEEAVETEGEYWQAIEEIYGRMGRLPHVTQNLMVFVTNPGAPSHPLYKRMIATDNPNRHVYYSLTEENPFLPDWYISNLKEGLDPKQAQRLLYGKWIEIAQEVIYYNYSRERNFINKKYKWDLTYPIDLMFDFNIGVGKPLSAAIGQKTHKGWNVAKTFIVEGARTQDVLDEIAESGILNLHTSFRIFGDATGARRDTRSKKSDYDIIEKFMANYQTPDGYLLEYESCVPRSNPPIRTRHNTMNALFYNEKKQVNLYVWKDANAADEGLRLTKLKKGASYSEDDSFEYQHVTTAIGYWVCEAKKIEKRTIDSEYRKIL